MRLPRWTQLLRNDGRTSPPQTGLPSAAQIRIGDAARPRGRQVAGATLMGVRSSAAARCAGADPEPARRA